MDFFEIKERPKKGGRIEVYPDFSTKRSTDLMIRGNGFYAVWDESQKIWTTDAYAVPRLIDKELFAYADSIAEKRGIERNLISVCDVTHYSTGKWAEFTGMTKKLDDNYHNLDSTITFANTVTKKEDYVSKRLPYSLNDSDCPAFNELIGKLYAPSEKEKIEWAIGSIISGDAKKIQKFMVLYGDHGTGKSTVLNIINDLFGGTGSDGYCATFNAKELASKNNQFSTEAFRNNPLVAIQQDGDLSKIEDNTVLNSIVSHEYMLMHEKYRSSYTSKAICFLFMATNKPVKITDAKSGIIRRLIVVVPSGEKFSPSKYDSLYGQIHFELGAIANHCLQVYKKLGKDYYRDYVPLDMMFKTDHFFNFVEYYYDDFKAADGVSLTRAFDLYKKYCEDYLNGYKPLQYVFREELKNYFSEFLLRTRIDGVQVRSYYKGFLWNKFEQGPNGASNDVECNWIVLKSQGSIFDEELSDCLAQYATEQETPSMKWANVTTTLNDIRTKELHFVKPPENLIVIDFDLKNSKKEKDLSRNLEEASKWPPTYCELSKGGSGLHLHYWYDGDVSKLSPLYSLDIEVKVFKGGSSLRRRLSKCNDIPIARLSSGLPLKEDKVVDTFTIQSEKALKNLILKNLRKEVHPGTKPSIDFIKKLLDDAYSDGLVYDLTAMRPSVLSFAAASTHHADYCIKLVNQMKFKSDDIRQASEASEAPIVFFDVEVFPNLFLVVWKFMGSDSPCMRLINPTPEEIENLFKFRLIGFNCRRYDNHILYARYLGYTEEELYILSQRIIDGSANCTFGEAYNISYTDVYDFSSKKQSLKKFEIELGIHHQELGLPWDQPVPKEKWELVAKYCDNDVIATEAVFEARQADWTARQILADIAGMTVNDTTNQLTTRIIFGKEKEPQSEFNYRFMGVPVDNNAGNEQYTQFDSEGRPVFPGYVFEGGVSYYRGEKPGEGGYVYAEKGMYKNVALLDIASMHPSSIVAEELFGPVYTRRFSDILKTRILIKHGEFEEAKRLFDGKLSKYLEDESNAKALAQALKIAINSVYGLTSAKFKNPFMDIRNKDNIVAKRGALFMINLKHEVQRRGYTVAHIKTDSIKIPDADQEIIDFVMEYGRMYGYNFEHEATYDRMCLVNDAVYIAKDSYDGRWTATGAQFQQPFVFKTLFSKEPLAFEDFCETKTVTSALYLDMNEDLPEDQHCHVFIGKAGLFTPIKPGCGGGLLLREKDGKFYSATGAKGYRWLESEIVKNLGKEGDVDISYYNELAKQAVKSISEYGNFDSFVNGNDIQPKVREEGPPPWANPCGDTSHATCFDCPSFSDGECNKGYNLEDCLFDRR